VFADTEPVTIFPATPNRLVMVVMNGGAMFRVYLERRNIRRGSSTCNHRSSSVFCDWVWGLHGETYLG